MTLYLCGPMSGFPEFNRPAFHAAAAKLRAAGYAVSSPAESDLPDTSEFEEWLRADIGRVLAADAVAILPGWQASRSARLETMVATALDLQVRTVPYWLTKAGQDAYMERLRK